MSITAKVRRVVRQRAQCACEFCGVTETDTGGDLTVDHFHPKAKGGTDELDNLLYCCHRCNQYKADYWPMQPDDPVLWHPRHDPIETHLLLLADGTLYPINARGTTDVAGRTANAVATVGTATWLAALPCNISTSSRD